MAAALAPTSSYDANVALLNQELDNLNAQLVSANAAGDVALMSTVQAAITTLNSQRAAILAQADQLDTPTFSNYLLDLVPTQGDTSASGAPASFSLSNLLGGLQALSWGVVLAGLAVIGFIVYTTVKK